MNAIRTSIKELLELLASEEAQVEYEKSVPTANVPAELVCMWFDDSYHPSSPQHIEAFSKAERDILAAFNEMYDARVESLPATLSGMHASQQWAEVVAEAQQVLSKIAW